ncbi:MAG: hypothetical protein QOH05_1795 [Acetobacteraceae bacterium]|jgi:hypothetical protein|nr:hypothetical protein [Acetobacteraceae bacterium]
MGAEAILFTPAIGLAILRVVSLLLIPALPLAAVRAAAAATGPAHTRLTPYIEIIALGIGVLFAPLLLTASSTDNILSLGDIFRSHGPWDLDFIAFLTRRALPLLLSPAELLQAVVTGHASADVARGTMLLGAAAFILVVGPIVALRNRAGVANSLRNLLLVLWGAYATIYTVALLLWLANVLNFWCFLVLFAATLLVHD